MPEPTLRADRNSRPMPDEDQEIRQRVREITSQLFQQGRLNAESVQNLVRAVTGAGAPTTGLQDPEVRQAFADDVRSLDVALTGSAAGVHLALEQLTARGKDFSENDLKDALLNLRKLQVDCVTAATRVAEAADQSLRREFNDITGRVLSVGADAAAGAASGMSELAKRFRESAASGLEVARASSVRMALLTSGVLQGVADALRDQASEVKNK